MKARKTLLSFLLFLFLTGGSAFSFGEVTGFAGQVEDTEQTTNEDFKSFLNKFTASASFQYSRVKFPLETPITLLTINGEERTFPFTKEKWPLLSSDNFIVERVREEEGSVYVSKFVVNEPKHKEFEAGYEESELDLRVVFDLIDGKWHVTDCYNAWYSYELPVNELQDTIRQVQEENETFKEQYP